MIASISSFRDFSNRSFCDGEDGDGSGDMNVICSRPEEADNVIYGRDVNNFRYYACVNLWVVVFSSYEKI